MTLKLFVSKKPHILLPTYYWVLLLTALALDAFRLSLMCEVNMTRERHKVEV